MPANKYIVDDGTKEIALENAYGQPICKIHFRASDLSVIDRYNAAVKDIDEIVKPLEAISIKNDGTGTFEDDWAVIKKAETELIQKINYILDTDDASMIFEKRNAFSSVGGVFFMQKVLSVIGNIISDTVAEETEKLKNNTAEYVKDL